MERRQAWRTLKGTKKVTIILPPRGGKDIWKFVHGVAAHVTPLSPSTISVYYLPSRLSTVRRIKHQLNFNISDVAFDPALDLLAVFQDMRVGASSVQNQRPLVVSDKGTMMIIHLLRLQTGDTHPHARTPVLVAKDLRATSEDLVPRVSFVNDVLCVTYKVARDQPGWVLIWNWTSGDLVVVRRALLLVRLFTDLYHRSRHPHVETRLWRGEPACF